MSIPWLPHPLYRSTQYLLFERTVVNYWKRSNNNDLLAFTNLCGCTGGVMIKHGDEQYEHIGKPSQETPMEDWEGVESIEFYQANSVPGENPRPMEEEYPPMTPFNRQEEPSDFESALNWTFSQIIVPDGMLPKLNEQKAWLLKMHGLAISRRVNEEVEAFAERVKATASTHGNYFEGRVISVEELDAELSKLKESDQ